MPFLSDAYNFDVPTLNTSHEGGAVYGLFTPDLDRPGHFTCLYVGQTDDLRKCLAEHYNNPPVAGATHFFAEIITAAEQRNRREAALIAEFNPPGFRRVLVAFALAAVAGALIWVFAGTPYLFDPESRLYYLGTLCAAGFVVGLLAPKHSLAMYAGIMTGQLAYMVGFLPHGPLWEHMVAFAFLGVFSIVSLLGAVLAKLVHVLTHLVRRRLGIGAPPKGIEQK